MSEIKKECRQCGEEFEGTKRQKLCSNCKKENKKKIDDAWRKANPRKKEVKSKSVERREKIQKEAKEDNHDF